MARKLSSIAIQHIKAAQAKFKALPQVMQDATNDAIEISVKDGAMQMAARAPRRHVSMGGYSGGGLKAAIGWKVNRRFGTGMFGVKSRRIIIAGRGGSALHSKGAKVYNPARTAHLVERGTVHSKAQPFARPTEAQLRPAHLDRVKRFCQQAGRDLATSRFE